MNQCSLHAWVAVKKKLNVKAEEGIIADNNSHEINVISAVLNNSSLEV